MSANDHQPLHGPERMRVGVRHTPAEDDTVTLQLQHGPRYRLSPGDARVLANRLERKADLADPDGARK